MDKLKQGNRYSNLISNTILFTISGFGPKLLSFALMPILTRVLSTSEYGTALNIINICNLILPIMYLCISESVIRFGMEENIKKSDVYTTSLFVVFIGYIVLLLSFPLIRMIPNTNEYLPLVYTFVLASALRTITTHFIRALGKVRLFAIDGILTTALNLIFVLIFLVVLKMGVVGYILATILPDIISTIFLTVTGRTLDYFTPLKPNKAVTSKMLRYSVPLVPAAVSWWITTVSNRLIITAYIGAAANGIFSTADKIPQILIIVSTIFIQAWQISAFSEDDRDESARFFSNIFKSYSALIFLAGSGIILLLKPMTKILVGPGYQSAAEYTPFLIVSVVFSCLVTFLGTIYNFNKKNFMVTLTTIIGAVINIGLNLMLIPLLGMQGAAIATAICYFIVFLIRLFDTKRFMNLNLKPINLTLNIILLVGQVLVRLSQIQYGIFVEIAITLLIVFNNRNELMFILRQGMGILYKRRGK